MARHEETKLYKEVKGSLLARLKENGTTEAYYTNLVEEYMRSWLTSELLYKDIEKRGVMVDYTDSKGNPNRKKNESVGERVKVVAQMLQIIASLGIKPGAQQAGGEDEL